MRILDGQRVCSPSDLTGFAACGHLTTLELRASAGEIVRPTREDAILGVLTRKGFEHEAAILEAYRADGREVLDLGRTWLDDDGKERPPTPAELEVLADETTDAMRAGVDVIAQGAFFHDGWLGYADFIERVPAGTSPLGPWSYEVADAKLARRAKPAALVQLCVYTEHVARIQGAMPEHLHVLTGAGTRETWRVDDALAYTRTLRARFDEFLAAPHETYGNKVEHCDVCRWNEVCDRQRRDDDHLALVARMRSDQAERLADAGVTTRRALAALERPPQVDGIGDEVARRLWLQARLQVAGDGAARPLHELIEPAGGDGGARLGFAALPDPSPGDLFIDFEGDPFAGDSPSAGDSGGLEYLVGIVDVADGGGFRDGDMRFRAIWAHDGEAEQAALEELIDLIVETRERHPDMHVYHYAPYETVAIKRLMGRYATREAEVDDLLRNDVFVDLYQVVRQAVRLSTESYGLKTVEKLYLDRPADDDVVTGGMDSVVAYEDWLVSQDPEALQRIEDYNRLDCESLVGLRDWLEDRRAEALARWGPPAPRDLEVETGEDLAEWEERRAALEASLTAGVPADVGHRTPAQQARWLLAQLLGWHQREDKPKYWRYFERRDNYELDDFIDDTECIGGLRWIAEIGPEKSSTLHRYAFPPQEHKMKVADRPFDPAQDASAGSVWEIGDDFLVIKRGPSLDGTAHPKALMPDPHMRNKVLREAIARVADQVIAADIEGDGAYRAARELLAGEMPRVQGVEPGAPLQRDAEEALDAACRIVTAMADTTLPIQGPPGSGKTYTGARMIVTALEAGMKVGITANSHAVITNLLDGVVEFADERGFALRAIQKYSDERNLVCRSDSVTLTDNAATASAALRSGSVQLAAGTPWLWGREDMESSVDLLAIDEAGQMSLANTVAVATATSRLVLLGDPQQLAQPSQGSHPPGSEVSALRHVLVDEKTMPAARGLFLERSFRMHPDIADFVSSIAYEGRLGSAAGRELQSVDGFSGLRFVPVEHTGNRTRSTEEAAEVARLFRSLVGTERIDVEGGRTKLDADDIIVIAPYNAHVAELRAALPDAARVGTVDKFQGREGAVAIYSMASSSAADAPRGIGFLYDLNRLNVAVSRARAAAYVVASPALLEVLCRRANQVPRVNALCAFVERADEVAPA